MRDISVVELYKENMKFSAAHFTIFSSEDREPLHGHNYTLYVALKTVVAEDGLSFDYRFYKDKIYQLCRQLNCRLLLPGQSKYLKIEEDETHYIASYNGQRMPFLKTDTTVLPIVNTTVEQLSKWFVERLVKDVIEPEHNIIGVLVKVFSGPGQSGSTEWEAN